MKNKLQDLTNHLFAQLERLNDDGLKEERLKDEIARAGAMTSVAGQILASGRLAIDAQRVAYDCALSKNPAAPALLGLDQMTREGRD
ncbi:hypothetical protein [Thiorhodococcus fuscus]|uniref:Phage protein n=1 Tax=Thiorhodococcus fuscus TaxID=527200 RepID=A0ABW4Y7D1_9GAMM